MNTEQLSQKWILNSSRNPDDTPFFLPLSYVASSSGKTKSEVKMGTRINYIH